MDDKQKAIEEHDRLSKLFKENRFLFEIERKRLIDKAINAAPEEERGKLRVIQDGWDNKLKNASTKNNRLILAQTMFYDQFGKFNNALQDFSRKE